MQRRFRLRSGRLVDFARNGIRIAEIGYAHFVRQHGGRLFRGAAHYGRGSGLDVRNLDGYVFERFVESGGFVRISLDLFRSEVVPGEKVEIVPTASVHRRAGKVERRLFERVGIVEVPAGKESVHARVRRKLEIQGFPIDFELKISAYFLVRSERVFRIRVFVRFRPHFSKECRAPGSVREDAHYVGFSGIGIDGEFRQIREESVVSASRPYRRGGWRIRIGQRLQSRRIRTPANGRFVRNDPADRGDVVFLRRVSRVLGIPRHTYEPHGRENGQYRDYDDEFHEREPFVLSCHSESSLAGISRTLAKK